MGWAPPRIIVHHNVLYGMLFRLGKGGQMADSEPPDDEPRNTARALTVIAPAPATMVVPAMVADLGEAAALRFIDFFTANIRNPNTRAAYAVAMRGFFRWLEKRGVHELGAVRTHHVSAYVEVLTAAYKAPTVKQHLAAIRMLFDWLIVGQVVSQNPAAAVRGPKHVVNKGKTPVLDGDEARRLLDSIDIGTVVGLRDRALIALLIYTFARVSAALHMNVEDYYPQGKRWWVRLHEKGGKQHEMPAPPPAGNLHRRVRHRRRHRCRQDISPVPYARRPRP